MKQYRKTILLIAGVMILLHGCMAPQRVDGNGSGTGNGMVIGKLFKPDGITPACGAIVVIRYKSKTAPVFAGTPEVSYGSLQTTITDENGSFSFDTIGPGLYVIEGNDNANNIVLIDSVTIEDPLEPLNLPPDTLRPAGSITGVVSLINGGNYRQVFVLAFGIDRFSQVNSDGTFLFTPFAQGTYNLKFISLDPQYGYVAMENVTVENGRTKDIGIVELPLKQSPVPKLRVEYDSLLMDVNISWSPTPSSVTRNYNVYRLQISDSVRSYKEIKPLERYMDTVIFESFSVPSCDTATYTIEYYVTVVDSSNNEGPAGDPVRITYRSQFEVVDTIRLDFHEYQNSPLVMTADEGFAGLFATEDNFSELPSLKVFSKSGKLIDSWSFSDLLNGSSTVNWNIKIDSDGNYCFTAHSSENDSLYFCKVNKNGTLSSLVSYDKLNSTSGNGYEVIDSTLYFPSESTIKAFNLSTRNLVVWKDFSSENMRIVYLSYDKPGRIIIGMHDSSYQYSIRWYSLDGILHQQYTLPILTFDMNREGLGSQATGVDQMLAVSDSMVLFSNFACLLSSSNKPVWKACSIPVNSFFINDTTFIVPDETYIGKFYYQRLRH